MFAIAEVDTRPGKQFGVSGRNADEPAYKIFNDARHDLAALATHLIELEFCHNGGASGEANEAKSARLRANLRQLALGVVVAECRARASRDPALTPTGPTAVRKGRSAERRS